MESYARTVRRGLDEHLYNALLECKHCDPQPHDTAELCSVYMCTAHAAARAGYLIPQTRGHERAHDQHSRFLALVDQITAMLD